MGQSFVRRKQKTQQMNEVEVIEHKEREKNITRSGLILQEELLYRKYNSDYDQHPHIVLRSHIYG